MSVRRIAETQPEGFSFTDENLEWAKELIAKYPEGKERSAVIPLLWRAQEQNNGWTSEPAMRTVADMLGMAYIRVYEVATFYTMFQLSPVGKRAHVQVCGTTPCMLRGSKKLIDICKKRISASQHTLSADGNFSWEEVECLGACVNAPMVQIFKDTYEDLDEKSLEDLLDAFAKGQKPKPGPQIDRDLSCPEGGLTSLIDVPAYVPLNLKTSDDHKDEDLAGENLKAEPVVNKEGAAEPASPPAPASDVDKAEAENAPEDEVVKDDPPATEGQGSSQDLQPDGQKTTLVNEPDSDTKNGEAAEPLSLSHTDRPEHLDAPRGDEPDDLKKIKGVGPKVEATLNSLGIYHFDQVAAWTEDNIAWVDEFLSFRGRIKREDWINQAGTLADGFETEFSKRAKYDDAPKTAGKPANDKPGGDS